MSCFIGCVILTLYPARHPLPSTTVRHDGRFRFSAGPRRQGQRGRREAQHEEDLRAQGREGFLRPRPGCGCPRGTTHSHAALLAVPRGAPAARERPRAGRRESAPARVRSAPRARVSVLSPSLRAVTAKRPSAPENLPRVSATRDRLGSDELIRFARRAISARGAWRAVISRTAARWPRVVLAKPRARPPRPPRPTTRARRVTPTGV